MKRRPDRKNVRQALAFSLAIAASLILLLVPVYTVAKLTAGGPMQVSQSTLLETVGPSIFVLLLIPVALTGLPLLLRGRARKQVSVVTAVALAVFVVIGSASIGWFYAPAFTAAIAALLASTGSPKRLHAHPS